MLYDLEGASPLAPSLRSDWTLSLRTGSGCLPAGSSSDESMARFFVIVLPASIFIWCFPALVSLICGLCGRPENASSLR